jgi:hypothetical protein
LAGGFTTNVRTEPTDAVRRSVWRTRRRLDLPDFDRKNAEFVLPPVDWPRVKRGAKSFFVYCSDDDPYVPLNLNSEIEY